MNKHDYDKTNAVIKALVQGNDPITGDPLPFDSVLNRADVLRALVSASSVLQEAADRSARRAMLPSNVGRPWSADEEATLIAAFKSDDPLRTIAARHGRTVRSIESRLGKLGLMTPEKRATFLEGLAVGGVSQGGDKK